MKMRMRKTRKKRETRDSKITSHPVWRVSRYDEKFNRYLNIGASQICPCLVSYVIQISIPWCSYSHVFASHATGKIPISSSPSLHELPFQKSFT